jgi:hypothetical protein
MAASHMITIEVALPPEQAEAALYQAFCNAGIKAVNGGGGYLRGITKTGWRSWGENVEAWIGPGPRGATVQLRSACSLPTQVVDWGKNRQNVELVVEAVHLLAPVV